MGHLNANMARARGLAQRGAPCSPQEVLDPDATGATAEPAPRRARRMVPKVPKPPWLSALEQGIARRLALHPNALSLVKLLVIAPLLFLALRQVDVLPASEALVGGLFVIFFVLDYLDGVAARERSVATGFGR